MIYKWLKKHYLMDYIEITGYKSIQNARIDFQPINILIGANGSGKSNFYHYSSL
jgi:predicted ATPase